MSYMKYLLFENYTYTSLLPFTFLRPAHELRMGYFTFMERWEHFLGSRPAVLSRFSFLSGSESASASKTGYICFVVNMIPHQELVQQAHHLPPDSILASPSGNLLAAHVSSSRLEEFNAIALNLNWEEDPRLSHFRLEHTSSEYDLISKRWKLFQNNQKAIEFDIPYLWEEKQDWVLKDPYTSVYGKDNLYVHPSAKVKAAFINAEDGPIFIGPGAIIEEGSIIKGAHAICQGAVVALGAKLRGNSTIGPLVKAGGEIKNSVLMAWSNKSHDGYLGNSVIGYGCNLGANTNVSNMKNTSGNIRQWDYEAEDYRDTGLQFCGLAMGDFSRAGINTMFNTGTLVGVFANIFGAAFPPKFVPSFSWGDPAGFSTYRLDKAQQVVSKILASKGLDSPASLSVELSRVFEETRKFRSWE